MSRINPYFEVEGKTYEIVRTRFLEEKYEQITSESTLTQEEERASANYLKLQAEYEEIAEKYNKAKNDYFDDILNEEKGKKYTAYKAVLDDKYKEIVDFSIDNKNFSLKKLQDKAYENGLKLLYEALEEQHKLSHKEAVEVWEKFTDHFGQQTAKDWVSAMINELFSREEEEENPFLKQAIAKAEQKAQQRNGLKRITK